LLLEHRRRGPIPLTWLWNDEFGGLDSNFASVDFERDTNGRVIGFLLNGSSRSRNYVFVKRVPTSH
jgi:hypothetical protein